MSTIGLFGFLCGSAVMISFFLSAYFLFYRSKESIRFVWLGVIFFAIGLRLGKSIVFFILKDMAPIGLSLGFIGLSTLGPMIWFHTRDKLKLKALEVLPHFIIPLAGAVFCLIITPNPWDTLTYISGTIVFGIYLVCSWISFYLKNDEIESIRTWKFKVLILVTGVWMALVYQHATATMMNYAVGSLIASIFIYWIFFESLNTQLHLNVQKVIIPDQTLLKIKEAFEKDELFRQQNMTLNDFSSQIDVPPYLVTKSVKKLYGRSFPDALNHFRVETIKNLLSNGTQSHLKIESIAYDAGFSSPSSFYASFKKLTGSSPTEYLKSMELKSA